MLTKCPTPSQTDDMMMTNVLMMYEDGAETEADEGGENNLDIFICIVLGP